MFINPLTASESVTKLWFIPCIFNNDLTKIELVYRRRDPSLFIGFPFTNFHFQRHEKPKMRLRQTALWLLKLKHETQLKTRTSMSLKPKYRERNLVIDSGDQILITDVPQRQPPVNNDLGWGLLCSSSFLC